MILPENVQYDHETHTTNWSLVFGLNSVLYVLLTLATLSMYLTILSTAFGYIGIWTHCVGCCLHTAAIITTGVYRYHTIG